ncbi:unnamed protein product [Amoebophrya sp. A120]|nr:unnamed protein product [Amoebophrya sp. A120]|eukprot:GSA120T00020323001.1
MADQLRLVQRSFSPRNFIRRFKAQQQRQHHLQGDYRVVKSLPHSNYDERPAHAPPPLGSRAVATTAESATRLKSSPAFEDPSLYGFQHEGCHDGIDHDPDHHAESPAWRADLYTVGDALPTNPHTHDSSGTNAANRGIIVQDVDQVASTSKPPYVALALREAAALRAAERERERRVAQQKQESFLLRSTRVSRSPASRSRPETPAGATRNGLSLFGNSDCFSSQHHQEQHEVLAPGKNLEPQTRRSCSSRRNRLDPVFLPPNSSPQSASSHEGSLTVSVGAQGSTERVNLKRWRPTDGTHGLSSRSATSASVHASVSGTTLPARSGSQRREGPPRSEVAMPKTTSELLEERSRPRDHEERKHLFLSKPRRPSQLQLSAHDDDSHAHYIEDDHHATSSKTRLRTAPLFGHNHANGPAVFGPPQLFYPHAHFGVDPAASISESEHAVTTCTGGVEDSSNFANVPRFTTQRGSFSASAFAQTRPPDAAEKTPLSEKAVDHKHAFFRSMSCSEENEGTRSASSSSSTVGNFISTSSKNFGSEAGCAKSLPRPSSASTRRESSSLTFQLQMLRPQEKEQNSEGRRGSDAEADGGTAHQVTNGLQEHLEAVQSSSLTIQELQAESNRLKFARRQDQDTIVKLRAELSCLRQQQKVKEQATTEAPPASASVERPNAANKPERASAAGTDGNSFFSELPAGGPRPASQGHGHGQPAFGSKLLSTQELLEHVKRERANTAETTTNGVLPSREVVPDGPVDVTSEFQCGTTSRDGTTTTGIVPCGRREEKNETPLQLLEIEKNEKITLKRKIVSLSEELAEKNREKEHVESTWAKQIAALRDVLRAKSLELEGKTQLHVKAESSFVRISTLLRNLACSGGSGSCSNYSQRTSNGHGIISSSDACTHSIELQDHQLSRMPAPAPSIETNDKETTSMNGLGCENSVAGTGAVVRSTVNELVELVLEGCCVAAPGETEASSGDRETTRDQLLSHFLHLQQRLGSGRADANAKEEEEQNSTSPSGAASPACLADPWCSAGFDKKDVIAATQQVGPAPFSSVAERRKLFESPTKPADETALQGRKSATPSPWKLKNKGGVFPCATVGDDGQDASPPLASRLDREPLRSPLPVVVDDAAAAPSSPIVHAAARAVASSSLPEQGEAQGALNPASSGSTDDSTAIVATAASRAVVPAVEDEVVTVVSTPRIEPRCNDGERSTSSGSTRHCAGPEQSDVLPIHSNSKPVHSIAGDNGTATVQAGVSSEAGLFAQSQSTSASGGAPPDGATKMMSTTSEVDLSALSTPSNSRQNHKTSEAVRVKRNKNTESTATKGKSKRSLSFPSSRAGSKSDASAGGAATNHAEALGLQLLADCPLEGDLLSVSSNSTPEIVDEEAGGFGNLIRSTS